MKILHLTIKKKWFDLIASGKKTMEYRENKPYWQKRLLNGETPKVFNFVRFKNGYGNVPVMDVEFKGITFTNPTWCIPANGEIITGSTIVVKLGMVLNINVPGA
ncbi:MAG TPA: hypothetical protein DD405_05060 [Desulfobacteraceae bacterium]|nr:hypothetical protein [Desulfobacteraceae bacterium]